MIIFLCALCGNVFPCNCYKNRLLQEKINASDLNKPGQIPYPPQNGTGSPPVSKGPDTGNGPDSDTDSEVDWANVATCVETYAGSSDTGGDSVDFALSFGRFPQWSGFSSGHLKLYSTSLDNRLMDGALLDYEHISRRRIVSRVNSTETGGNRIGLLTEKGYMRYADFSHGSTAVPFGGSEIFQSRLRMTDGEGMDFSGAVEEAPFFEESFPDGSIIRYNGANGLIESIRTKDGVSVGMDEITSELAVIHVNSRNQVIRHGQIKTELPGGNDIYDDRIRQIWNRADGLLDFPTPDVINWYSPADLTGDIGEDGLFIINAGIDPVRSWVIEAAEWTEGHQLTAMSVRETKGLYASPGSWKSFGEEGTFFIKGEGEDAQCSVKVRESLDSSGNIIVRPNGMSLQVAGAPTGLIAETKYQFKGAESFDAAGSLSDIEAESVTRSVFKSYDFGDVRISHSKAYNTALEKTWSYVYEVDPVSPNYGKLVKTVNPDGSEITKTYDSQGSVATHRIPWLNGEYRETRYSYLYDSINVRKISHEREVHITAEGKEIVLCDTGYRYEETDSVKRSSIIRSILGVENLQTEVSEWYKNHECPYAIGRLRRRKTVDGQETFYDYESADDTGTLWKVIETQCVRGDIVAGKSTRTVTYIDARGDTVAVDERVHDGTDFVCISSRFMTYDEAHHVIRTKYGNGKEETAEWSCCGPLWEIDTDGVQTRYTYNSVKQLVRRERDSTPLLEDYNAPCSTTQAPMHITEYEYDGMGHLVATVTTVGEKQTRTMSQYDKLGRIVSATDESGNTTGYEYSADGLVTTVIQPTGATLITTRNPDGSVSSRTGTGQQNLYYTYATTLQGVVTRVYEGSLSGSVLRETLEDGSGRVILDRVPTASETGEWMGTRTSYDGCGRPVRVEHKGEAPLLVDYDELGNEIRNAVKLGEGAEIDVATDRVNEKQIRYTTLPAGTPGLPEGFAGICIFRESSTTLKLPDGTDVSACDYVLVSSPPSGSNVERLALSKNKYGQWSYTRLENIYGNKFEYRSVPGSSQEQETVSVDGRILRRKEASGVMTYYDKEYTVTGEILKVTDSLGNTVKTEFDRLGRKIKVTDSGGNSVYTEYDPLTGDVKCVTDALGNQICYTYDIRKRKTSQYGSGTYPVKWEYDDAGRLISMRTWRTQQTDDSSGDRTRWLYDSASGKLMAKEYADGTRTAYHYNEFDQLDWETNGDGRRICYSYKPLSGELISKIMFSNGGNPELESERQTFEYDSLGRLMRVTDAAGITSYEYNGYADKVKEILQSGQELIEKVYGTDAFGRRSGYSLMLNNVRIQSVDLTYDLHNRLSGAKLDGNEQFLYGYNEDSGFRDRLQYPNGVVQETVFDPRNGRPADLVYRREELTHPLYHEKLFYDEGNHLTRREDDLGQVRATQNYAYNSRGELIEADLAADREELVRLGLINPQSVSGDVDGNFAFKKQNWTYDPIGNRKQAGTEYLLKLPQGLENSCLSYNANSLNQYDKDEYDQSGNQTLLHTGGYTWHVQYNAENRPVLFRRERNMAEDQEVSLVMRYDSSGRRTVKTAFVNGTMVDSRKFVYDEFLLVAELRSRNAEEPGYTLHQTFLWDPAETIATRPLCMTCWRNGVHEEESNASLDYTLECFNRKQADVPFWIDGSPSGRYFYIQDHNKNIKAIVSGMGELIGEYDYSSYGEMVASTVDGIVSGNPFRFSSEYYDRELGLYYYNYRHYNPTDGRWISRDTIGETGGSNLYGFVCNKPIILIDRLGLAYVLGTKDPTPKQDPDDGAGVWNSKKVQFSTLAKKAYIMNFLFDFGRKWPDATKHLLHYFENTGSDYTIRLQNMIDEVEDAKTLYEQELGMAQAFVESLPNGKYQITSEKMSGSYNNYKQSPNWFYAVGGYSAWGKGNAVVCKGATPEQDHFTLEFEYKFYDRYDWDGGKQVTVGDRIVTDDFMGEFHRQGLAKEFNMNGSVKKTVKWKRGKKPKITEGWKSVPTPPPGR